MTIETKFNVRQEVFLLQNSIVEKRRIDKVMIELSGSSPNPIITYTFGSGNTQESRYEDEIAADPNEFFRVIMKRFTKDSNEPA